MKHQQTAYSYRRYIELVQVLALDDNWDAAMALCEVWGVKPYEDELGVTFYDGTIQRLAKAAIEHHAAEREAE